jgi:NADH dehydrogenase
LKESNVLSNSPVNTSHVVVVGAGFAGLNCAFALAKHPSLRVTLIDRNNYQQFQPLLYQVATASLAPTEAAFNLREAIAQHPNVDVRMTEITSVDLASRTARGKFGDEYSGDYLVLAAGSHVNFFGTPGASEFAYPMYTLRDAERLKSRILELLEAADIKGNSLPHFAVIGGGTTGVEVTGALADTFDHISGTSYKHLSLRDIPITLVNGSHALLSGFKPKSQQYAEQMLQERRVTVLNNKRVKEVRREELLLDDGMKVPCNLAVWAGGLQAGELAGNVGVAQGAGGRLNVQSDLTLANHPRVFALGDFANTTDEDGEMLPQLAAVAQQAGRHCARNILAQVEGRETIEFRYQDKGIMAMVGRNAAIVEAGEGHHSLTGPIAYATWLGVHAVLLTTLHAKLAAFVEWTADYFGHRRVQAILDSPSEDNTKKNQSTEAP